jgi:hypothetical protein
MDSN